MTEFATAREVCVADGRRQIEEGASADANQSRFGSSALRDLNLVKGGQGAAATHPIAAALSV
jgi:hypothetical protein